MKTKILLGFVLVAVAAAMGWQQSAISRTRTANETLRQQNAAPAVVAKDAAPVPTEEIAALETANRDLPKLRNEVRKLREERRELEELQVENKRLAAALKATPKTTVAPISESEGFVLRQKWTRAGFATPEGTVQTFFWAIANKDAGSMAECMAGDARKSMEQEIQRSIAQGKRFEEQFEPFAKMQGFRVAQQKQLSDDKVELSIQAAAGGRELLMHLQLINGEWKLSN